MLPLYAAPTELTPILESHSYKDFAPTEQALLMLGITGQTYR